MPSPRERYRNNIRMGVFVSFSLLLALVVVVMLTGWVERYTAHRNEYTVEFTLRAGVTNLERGSAVRVGGVKLGEVVEVRPRFADRPFDKIDVVFTVDNRVELFGDAQVFVSSPLIAAEAWLDIPSVGTPEAGPPPGGRLAGAERVGFMTTMLGTENAAKTDEILENMRQFSQVFARVPEDYDTIIDNVKLTTADVRGLVGRISHDDWPQWSASVSRVVEWAAGATESLDLLLDQGNALLADARGVVGENRAGIERVVTNIEATSADLRELMAWLNADGRERAIHLMETAGDAIENTRDVLTRLSQDYDRWATDLGFVMANANHASQQLKLAMTEVRRAPWKALHIPSAQEVEHEYLYEAMRNFALAAADLKAASVAAQRILDNHSETLSRDEAALDRLTRNLINQVEKYEEAQNRLMNVLIQP